MHENDGGKADDWDCNIHVNTDRVCLVSGDIWGVEKRAFQGLLHFMVAITNNDDGN